MAHRPLDFASALSRRATALLLLTMFGVVIANIELLSQTTVSGSERQGEQQSGITSAARLEKTKDGIITPFGDHFLKVQVCADNVIRVAFGKDRKFFSRSSLAVEYKRPTEVAWTLKKDGDVATITTAKLQARVNLASGAVSFHDLKGSLILAEKQGGRTMTPDIVQGDETFHVRQEWQQNTDEALYGLGQQQLGLMNIKGYDLDLWQHNGTIAIPFLTSSKGYGIFWDNTAFTRFGDVREFEPIPSAQLFDMENQAGGLTGSYFSGDDFQQLAAERKDSAIEIEVPAGVKNSNQQIHRDLPPTGNVSVRWEGEVVPDATGDYLFQTYSNNGIKLWINNELVISHWRQGWLPWKNIAKVHLEAGKRYHLKLEWNKEQGMETVRLLWKTPFKETTTSLWSEVGEGIDYYFVYGPELDQVIAGYRRITGEAPMPPRWAFGLWQSRQRYKTAQESLDVLEGYRSRGIPLDNIVQDWQYWKEDSWGSHEFDPARFPNPDEWIHAIHEKYHAQLMLSVWPKFYAGTNNFQALRERGFLYESNLGEEIKDWLGHPDSFYDAFNPEARKLFWSQLNQKLFNKGIDAWWMDASEPDLLPTPTLQGQRTHVHPTALGTGARMLNAYPLVNAEAIYQGQREAAPDQRVFILTRSGFAGLQRYASAVWSGDISSTWAAMRAQITAGLGYGLSGLPYWTMDIGGFSVPARFSRSHLSPENSEEWRELNTRWFEFGTFVPLLRVHGEFPNREMWEFGGESSPVYQAQLKFDRLRYRLFPYIYSLAGNVTHGSGTIMRALVMDFPNDPKVLDVKDEYIFGSALLISPITTYKARSRAVYLPRGEWYDFWTGQLIKGDQMLDAPAPYDSLPIHVRAGSIIPIGSELQYIGEKPSDPITLYIYTGADGAFTLYEDDGLTYQYETGAFSRIPITWNEAARTLTIGDRVGVFNGMLKGRTFNVVLVSKDKPIAFSFSPKPNRTVNYHGERVSVQF